MRRLCTVLGTICIFCATAWPLAIDNGEIGISKMIPAVGDTVTWAVPVVNDSGEEFAGEVTMTMSLARRGEALGAPVSVTREVSLAGAEDAESLGGRVDFEFDWTPARNGWYRVVFEVPHVARVEREIAVTEKDVWFAWFGCPQDFRWCNVPTTVKTEDVEWWLRRGAIPGQWKGGVCYSDWPLEEFVESWGGSNWIAIDEVGGPGEITDKFIAAWEQLEQQHPDQWRAVWYMGAHEYWGEIDHLIDLFLPEIYLNYRGNHLGQFDSYLRIARAAGVIDKTIPALGINQIRSDRGLVRNSPTRADVLRQFRYLKRTAPELNGIGFFTSFSAAPGVAEYADELCGEYYVNPLLTIQRPSEPIEIRREGNAGRALARVRNVGGMDAENVRLEWVIGWPEGGARLHAQTVERIAVGESALTSVDLPDEGGWGPVELRIAQDDSYTVLDGRARIYVPWRGEESIVAVLPGIQFNGPVLQLVDVPDQAPRHLVGLTRDGQREALDTPCTILPPRPGVDEHQAAFSRDGRAQPTMVLLEAGRTPSEAEPPAYEREGERLIVHNDAYRLELDLGADAIASIVASGGDELLRGPWVLTAPGHEEIGEARVEELPGALAVTVPWESEVASGESQYVFFSGNPAIRVARLWRPKGEVTVGSAADSCELFQRGGTYALQRGVGALVQRGRLRDGNDYRDLLFGYGGSSPGPTNADRAGWVDFSYGDGSGGLGVAIDYRWQDAASKSYDVTRLYDGADSLEVLYVWGTEATIDRPQTSCIWLVPHGTTDLLAESGRSTTEILWRHLHEDQLAIAEGLPRW